MQTDQGFWYLASPYSNYAGGREAAFKLAAVESARLIRAGVPVFSPIAHSHPIAEHGGIDPLDHDVWLPLDTPMMDAARGLIVLTAEGWNKSRGVLYEINVFWHTRKPMRVMSPGELPSWIALDVLVSSRAI